jgi:replicative DNA helicase
MIERIPPQAIDAEQVVLGAALQNESACHTALNLLTPGHFYHRRHRKIFSAIVDLEKSGSPIDIVTVLTELQSRKQDADIGGRKYLMDLTDSVVTFVNTGDYCNTISDCACKNSTIEKLTEIIAQCYDPETKSLPILTDIETAVKDIRAMRLDKIPIRTGKDMAETLNYSIDHAKLTHITGYRTGYTMLDNLILGLQQGYFIILAARPSMGKTALALNITKHLAFSEKIPTLFISLETSELAIGRRFATIMGGVSSYRLRRGNLEDHELIAVAEITGTMSSSPFYLAERKVSELNQIVNLIERAVDQYGVKVVFIDYLQIIQHRSRSRNEEVMEISGKLQSLSHGLDIPIIALSQLSREADGQLPQLKHLRDSGAVEQDAAQVIFLHRDRDAKGQLKEDGLLMVAKAKDEKTGNIGFQFDGERMQFIMIDNNREEAHND